MRRFLLVRHRDPSGVSGTGIVAEGVEFSDGSATLRWYGDHPTTTLFESGLLSIEAIHGHGGATEVMYADPSPDPQRVPAQATGNRVDRLCKVCGAAWPCAHHADDDPVES